MNEEPEKESLKKWSEYDKKNLIKRVFLDYLPMLVTAGCIIGFGIHKHTPFIKMLPTLVSLIIMLLTARVSRIALLMGSVNCLIYLVGFFMEKIYASVASVLLFDFPFQLVSFFMWKKNSNKQELIVKRLNGKKWLLLLMFDAIAWTGFYFVYRAMGTQSLILDNTIFILGLTKYILMLTRYLENNVFTIITLFTNLALWINLTIVNPENVIYIISTSYSIYMIIRSLIKWVKLYKKQNNKNMNSTQVV